MKCSECNTKNIVKANYCKKCGNKFSKSEQTTAYNKTIYGKITLFEEWYEKFSLKIITDSIIFKVIILLIILGFGIYSWYINGISFTLLDSEAYDIYYNDKLNEYYLITEENVEEIALNVYVPNRLNDIKIEHYDISEEFIKEIEYREDEDIVLETYNDDYYLITSKYSNGNQDRFKVYLYNKDKVELSK